MMIILLVLSLNLLCLLSFLYNRSDELRKSAAKVIKKRPPRPPNKQAVVDWFLEEERPKGVGTDPCTGKVAQWFHGECTMLWFDSLKEQN